MEESGRAGAAEETVIPILFLASDLSPGSPTRHLLRLAAALNRDRFRVEIASLDGSRSYPGTHPIRFRHPLDFQGYRSLRALIQRLQPKIVHAWGPEALRASVAVTRALPEGGYSPRLVVSEASFTPSILAHFITRRRLRSCDRVTPATWVEAERYRGLRVPTERLTRIAPGVDSPPTVERTAVLRSLGLPESARYIVTSGRLSFDSGIRFAIWAFDLLHDQFPDLHLVILGDGPARAQLEAFARSTMVNDYRVCFAGDRVDGANILAAAEAAWAVHPQGDVQFILESMASGVPVFAWRLPEVEELLDDGTTGVLAEAGQASHLASKAYPILGDASVRDAIGAAGQAAALERFSSAREVEHFAALYSELQ